jgi:hypothetical protein
LALSDTISSAILLLPFGVANIASGVLLELPFSRIKFRRFTGAQSAGGSEIDANIGVSEKV